jgi:hypothetical protein
MVVGILNLEPWRNIVLGAELAPRESTGQLPNFEMAIHPGIQERLSICRNMGLMIIPCCQLRWHQMSLDICGPISPLTLEAINDTKV